MDLRTQVRDAFAIAKRAFEAFGQAPDSDEVLFTEFVRAQQCGVDAQLGSSRILGAVVGQ